MKRREFITLLGSATAWPLAVRAQQAMPIVGYFSARTPESDVPMLVAFRQGLNDAGYVEGKNVAIEFRWAKGQYDLLPTLAKDLVRRKVTIVVTSGGEDVALAAKAATTRIPIVFIVATDPVRFGLVASFNRPGGNLTGVTSLIGELGPKQLGLLRELAPDASVLAVLVNPNDPWTESQVANTVAAARAVGRQLIVLRASTETEIDTAFTSLLQQRAGALVVTASAFFVTRETQLVSLAARHSLPAIFSRSEFAAAGGLMSYGPNTAEYYRQAGAYTGQILSGTKPADLPVMQPTKYELVINLKTAKALGLTVPPALLSRADEVIE